MGATSGSAVRVPVNADVRSYVYVLEFLYGYVLEETRVS